MTRVEYYGSSSCKVCWIGSLLLLDVKDTLFRSGKENEVLSLEMHGQAILRISGFL